MEKISPAKVNLCLDILGKDNLSGFHYINTIITPVFTLFDRIKIEKNKEDKIRIFSNCKNLPKDKNNLCFKAVNLLIDPKQLGGVDIFIEKNIPIAAGLGGGSSNAATTMLIINDLFNLNHSHQYLAELGSQISKDLPFFIYGKTAYAFNFGEKIEILPSHPDFNIHLLLSKNPSFTNNAYANLNYKFCGLKTSDTEKLKAKFLKQDYQEIYKFFHNDFEKSSPHFQEIEEAKKQFIKKGAKTALMSGSGNAVFGFF